MLAVAVLFLTTWQLLPPVLGVPKYIIPVPTDMLAEFRLMLVRDSLVRHTLSTAAMALAGFAICVSDLESSAQFYETVLELKRVGGETLDIGSAVYMSDGVINLALLKFEGERGSGLKDAATFTGPNHFGFQVDDLAETQRRIEAAGGRFFFDLGDERRGNFERKFKDPTGSSSTSRSTAGWGRTGGRSRVEPAGVGRRGRAAAGTRDRLRASSSPHRPRRTSPGIKGQQHLFSRSLTARPVTCRANRSATDRTGREE